MLCECLLSSLTHSLTSSLLEQLPQINAHACDATGCWEPPHLEAPPAVTPATASLLPLILGPLVLSLLALTRPPPSSQFSQSSQSAKAPTR